LNNAQRLFENAIINNPQNFYIALSLGSKDGSINEPTDKSYKRAEINFKNFGFDKRFNLKNLKEEIFYFNRFPIFFDESNNPWGKIKSLFIIDEENNIWISQNLKKERNVGSRTTLLFNIGEFIIDF
jgi:hypothetical protein